MNTIQAITSLADKYPRLGYRMLHNIYSNDGGQMNHKRFYRIYKQENLALRRRKKKKVLRERVPLELPEKPGICWSMDFVFDRTKDGRRLKIFAIVDNCSKESIWIEVDRAINGGSIAQILDNLCLIHGKPLAVRSDNGSKFTSSSMVKWLIKSRVKLIFIQPGKPTQNAYCESFNSRIRHECLNANLFLARLSHLKWQVFDFVATIFVGHYKNFHSSLFGVMHTCHFGSFLQLMPRAL